MNVLLVASDPLDENLAPIMSLEELQAIGRSLTYMRADVTVTRLVPATWQRLRQTLMGRGPFDVVHFIGHSTGQEVLLEDEYGATDYVSASDLAHALVDRDVRLVILNVCESESPAGELVASGIPTVVATTRAITNRQAIIMAEELYAALAVGLSVADAMKCAQVALERAEGPQAATTPVLAGDATLGFEPTPKRGHGYHAIALGLPANNLRSQAAFFGRVAEMRRGLELLADAHTRAINVTGLRGIGKTAFACQLAWRGAWRFPGGVMWFRASEHSQLMETYLASGITQVLPIELSGSADAIHRDLLRLLSEQPILMVFDDADRLPDTLRESLADFMQELPIASGSKCIIVTSIPCDTLDDMEGLARLQLRGLAPRDSLRFLQRSAALQDVAELVCASSPQLRSLAARLGHHPKMMELAVGLTSTLGLSETLRSLSVLPRSFGNRVAMLLADSLAALQPPERRILSAGSLFVGPFPSDWLVGICGEDALDSLLGLVGANLVDRDQDSGWFELHPLVRDYVSSTAPPGSDLRWSHARLMLQQVTTLNERMGGSSIKGQPTRSASIANEALNAARWVASTNTDEGRSIVITIATGLRDYLHLVRRDWASIQTLEEVVAGICQQTGDRREMGTALTSLGASLAAQGNPELGLARCQEGLAILDQIGGLSARSIGYGALGFVTRLSRQLEDARDAYAHAQELARAAGDQHLELRHLSNLGTVHRMSDDHDAAEIVHQAALDLAKALGDRRSEGILLDQLGTDARKRGDATLALKRYTAAYAMKSSAGDPVGLRVTRNNLAITLKDLGQPRQAAELLQEALAQLDDTGTLMEQWMILLQLARTHRDLQDWETSSGYYWDALELAEAARYTRGIAMCERGLGLCCEQTKELRAAYIHLSRAVDLSTEASDAYLPQVLQDLHRVQVALIGG